MILDSLILLVKCIVSLMVCSLLTALLYKYISERVLLLGASLLYALHMWMSEVRFLKKCSCFDLLFYMILLCLFSSFFREDGIYYDMASSWKSTMGDFSRSLYVAIAAPSLIAISAILRVRRGKQLRWQEWISIPLAILFVLCGNNISFVALLAVALLGYAAYDGCRRDDLVQMNSALVVYILCVCFVLVDFDYVVRDIFGISRCGVDGSFLIYSVLLAMINYIRMSIQRKKSSLLKKQGEAVPSVA